MVPLASFGTLRPNYRADFFERAARGFGDAGEIFVYVFCGSTLFLIVRERVNHFLMIEMGEESFTAAKRQLTTKDTKDTKEKGDCNSFHHGGHVGSLLRGVRGFGRSKALTSGALGCTEVEATGTVEGSYGTLPMLHLTIRVALVANQCTIRDDIWLPLSHRTHKDLLAKWRPSRSASQRRKHQEWK